MNKIALEILISIMFPDRPYRDFIVNISHVLNTYSLS